MSHKHQIDAGGGKIPGFAAHGTRSEYMAAYGLSRFCFVTNVYRQNDFGIADFFCTLGRRSAPAKRGGRYLVLPEASFYVQVKSSPKTYELNEDIVRWIANHVSNPFFVCIAEQDKNRLSLYSCTYVWQAIIRCPWSEGFRLFFDKSKMDRASKGYVAMNKDRYVLASDSSQRATVNIFLGQPILEQTLDQLETDQAEHAYSILRRHVDEDINNIINFKRGGITTTHTLNDQTQQYIYRNPDSYWNAEKAIHETLRALLVNYQESGYDQRERCLAEYMKAIGLNIQDDVETIDVSGHGED